MPSWIDAGWDIFKLVAPWLTGGLAGAALTYLLNQRLARRKQARLQLTTDRVDYSLASRDEQLKELRVSYRGNEFDNLLLYQIRIENVSTKTISRTPFLLRLSQGTNVVDQRSMTYPLGRQTVFIRQDGHECAYLWEAGELKPRDSAELKLLLAPTTAIDCAWRGDDEVDVTGYGRETLQTTERELRDVLVWISAYVFLGGLPLVSGLAQGTLLLISVPYLLSYCVRWWPLISKREAPNVNIVAGHSSSVALAIGPARASVPAQIADPTKALHDDGSPTVRSPDAD
ncbi:hypothetical protein [Bradyrhizobium sp. HKCCYLRH1065]|uniref:hypothetical protein n=1 Tax=unclassified Bradyrhizobium TaxID=2631580 RepID=UPI003EBAE93C